MLDVGPAKQPNSVTRYVMGMGYTMHDTTNNTATIGHSRRSYLPLHHVRLYESITHAIIAQTPPIPRLYDVKQLLNMLVGLRYGKICREFMTKRTVGIMAEGGIDAIRVVSTVVDGHGGRRMTHGNWTSLVECLEQLHWAVTH